MAATRAVRWGVIGLGWFGEVHAEALSQMPGIELAALCTRRASRLEELGNRFKVKARYTDYRQLLSDPGVEAVSVVTHIQDHRDIAIEALRAGKHVLLEKPMAPDVPECEAILAAAREATGLFMVGHICRFDPRSRWPRKPLRRAALGTSCPCTRAAIFRNGSGGKCSTRSRPSWGTESMTRT